MAQSIIDIASRFLAQNDKICLICHTSPDGDTLGGAFGLFYALKSLGKSVYVESFDGLPEKFQYLYPDNMEKFEPKHYVTVDVADVNLLGDCQKNLSFSLCIDHHEKNSIEARYKCVDSGAAAICEVIYLILRDMNIKISKQIANCLYTGISTDTGCFRFSNTTPQTHKIAAELIESGAKSCEINFRLFEQKTKARLKLESLILKNLEYYFGDRCAIVFVTRDMVRQAGASETDFDEIASIARSPIDVLIGISAREVENCQYKVSVRSNQGASALNVCKFFGGGGHKMAAGFKISGDMQAVKEKILQRVYEEIIR